MEEQDKIQGELARLAAEGGEPNQEETDAPVQDELGVNPGGDRVPGGDLNDTPGSDGETGGENDPENYFNKDNEK